jgi:hypothetical protein
MTLKRILLIIIFICGIKSYSIYSKNTDVQEIKQLQVTSLNKKKNNKTKQILKLTSDLNNLYNLYKKNKDCHKYANQFQIEFSGENVTVTILPQYGFTIDNIDIEALSKYRVKVLAKAEHSMRVQIPVSQLENVATKVDGIGSIRKPIKPEELEIISEGVNLMNADHWQESDYLGNGIKIAVIDAGFSKLTEAQNNGDIPASYISHDFTGTGLETSSEHGTAVAEAIFDIVPQAQLYLYKISDITDIENAKDSCKTNGIDIINHSMGWVNTGGYYNGEGIICAIANDAIANGITWINAAGNWAETHYRSVFTADQYNYHTFNIGVNINLLGLSPYSAWLHDPGETIIISLNWDAYPVTNKDYNLYLLQYSDSGWVEVANSTQNQTGTTSPEEFITYVNQDTGGIYGVLVEKASVATDVDFTLFSLGRSFAYHTSQYSITDPATASDVVSVGAISRNKYSAGPQENFSSQGPTTDGRIKPDIAAPDNCNSYVYGYWTGTSLSSPHVAGVCALIKSRFPEYNSDQVVNYLYNECAVDLGTTGKDNIYGWGKLVMPDPISVTINSPNGSEYWKVGSQHNITWTSNFVDNVKLEYSSDKGDTWNPIIASTSAANGTYSWTVPDAQSTVCLIRITDVSNSDIYDISDETFIIYQTYLTLTQPNGGEIWRSSSNQTITWTSKNIDNVKLEYSSDSGSTWNLIIASTPADTAIYFWTIPDIYSLDCLVKITDATDNNTYDISNNDFTIYLQFITVITPDGGESWKAGTNQNIAWTAYNIENVKLEYSTDNGSTWSLVIDSIAADTGIFSWTTPNLTSTNCFIRISDITDDSTYDISNKFIIYIPHITIIQPNGGEEWEIGSDQQITWQSSYVENIKLEYSTDSGSNWLVIKESMNASAGLTDWNIPIPASDNCFLKIHDINDTSVYDISDNKFAISVSHPTEYSLEVDYDFPDNRNFSEMRAIDYRIIGLPGSCNLPIEIILGVKHLEEWQVYWDNGAPSNYLKEFDGSTDFWLTLGRAFWIIKTGDLKIDLNVNTQTLNSNYTINIPLHSGWNLITNPYLTTISWARIQAENNISNPIFAFNNASGFISSTLFESYKGYYFFNNLNMPSLKIPYILTVSKNLIKENTLDWRVNLKLVTKDYIDEAIYLGISSKAKSGLDAMDYRKPRSFSHLPTVCFNRPDWDRNYKTFATDIRNEIINFEKWDFEVYTPCQTEVKLYYSGIKDIPLEHEVYLLDHSNLTYSNLREDSIYTFLTKPAISEFSIFVGKLESIKKQLNSIQPTEFKMSGNIPNPFNGTTVFSIDIPVSSEISLFIYNMLGEQVRKLYSGNIEPGRHWFQWDSRDDLFNILGSGIYIIQLISNTGFCKTEKMILIK